MKIWVFLLRFFIFLTVLFLLWIPVSPYYTYLTLWPLTWLFPLVFGIKPDLTFSSSSSAFWESAFTNIVPFLALMFSTYGWRIQWKKRLWQIALGIALLYIFRVADRFLGYWLTRIGATDAQITIGEPLLYFLIQLGKILFPIMLWLLFCFRDLQGFWDFKEK